MTTFLGCYGTSSGMEGLSLVKQVSSFCHSLGTLHKVHLFSTCA